jgi:PPOX class probable F420-dependent enzyme
MPRTDRLSQGGVKLLQERQLAIIATVMSDGSPQTTPVWVDVEPDGSHILINTVATHLKMTNINRDPRVAITIVDSQNPWRCVVLRGRVVEKRGADQGAIEHIHMLAKKYLGRDQYPLADGEARVILRIKPTHVVERGTDGQRLSRWTGM